MNEKIIIEYLIDSINNHKENSNNNETKLDTLFIKQTSVFNLLLVLALIYSPFLKLISNSLELKTSYFIVLFTFILTHLFTVSLTVWDKWDSINKYTESEKLYMENADKVEEEIDSESDQQIRKQILRNNTTYMDKMYTFTRICEDSFRIINIFSLILFIVLFIL